VFVHHALALEPRRWQRVAAELAVTTGG